MRKHLKKLEFQRLTNWQLMAIVELLLSKSEYYLIFVGLNAVYLNPHFRKFFSQFSLEEIFQNLFETGKYLFSLSLKASGYKLKGSSTKRSTLLQAIYFGQKWWNFETAFTQLNLLLHVWKAWEDLKHQMLHVNLIQAIRFR